MENLLENSYYKVVSINKKKQLVSAITRDYYIHYKFKKWVKPDIGKIFIFDTLKNAKKFLELNFDKPWRIYKCYAKNVGPIEQVLQTSNFGLLHCEAFWDNKLNNDEKIHLTCYVLRGTLVADSVMLYQKVN